MRHLFLPVLLTFAFGLNSNAAELPPEALSIAALHINRQYDDLFFPDIKLLIDLIDREEKVAACVVEYIRKQSRSYAKIAQNNLYDLIHNFDRVASRIYGKKQPPDKISYEEKIEALGKLQCEAYYAMRLLK